MKVACALGCGELVDTNNKSTYRRVTGWERKAWAETRKSGSDIVLREPLDEYAHPACIARVRAGLNVRQEALL